MEVTLKQLDTIIVSNQHPSKKFAGRIGFISLVRKEDGRDNERYDIQFPYIHNAEKGNELGWIYQQLCCGSDEVTLIQSY